MPQKMSGSFGSGASSHTAMPGISARSRGSAMTPKPAGESSFHPGLLMYVGNATSSTAASTDPPRVSGPAATSSVSQTSDWKKFRRERAVAKYLRHR